MSGFQVAGFSHVVGCLWPSINRVCVEVERILYVVIVVERDGIGRARGGIAVREAVMAVLI